MLAVTSSLFSRKSRSVWGGADALILSLTLSPSHSNHGVSSRGEEGGRRDAALLRQFCGGLLGSACWLIRLLTTFELHSSRDWQWFPPRRQFEHINIKVRGMESAG